MSEQLARVRADVEAMIAREVARHDGLSHEIEQVAMILGTFREVLAAIDKIEAETPEAPATPERQRAPRRDLRGAILSALGNFPHGLSPAELKAEVENQIGETTESTINRALTAMVDAGKLRLYEGLYYDHAPPRRATAEAAK